MNEKINIHSYEQRAEFSKKYYLESYNSYKSYTKDIILKDINKKRDETKNRLLYVSLQNILFLEILNTNFFGIDEQLYTSLKNFDYVEGITNKNYFIFTNTIHSMVKCMKKIEELYFTLKHKKKFLFSQKEKREIILKVKDCYEKFLSIADSSKKETVYVLLDKELYGKKISNSSLEKIIQIVKNLIDTAEVPKYFINYVDFEDFLLKNLYSNEKNFFNTEKLLDISTLKISTFKKDLYFNYTNIQELHEDYVYKNIMKHCHQDLIKMCSN